MHSRIIIAIIKVCRACLNFDDDWFMCQKLSYHPDVSGMYVATLHMQARHRCNRMSCMIVQASQSCMTFG